MINRTNIQSTTKRKTSDTAWTTVGLLKQTVRLKELEKFLQGYHNNIVIFFYPHLYESTVFYALYFYLLWSELMTKTLTAKVLWRHRSLSLSLAFSSNTLEFFLLQWTEHNFICCPRHLCLYTGETSPALWSDTSSFAWTKVMWFGGHITLMALKSSIRHCNNTAVARNKHKKQEMIKLTVTTS